MPSIWPLPSRKQFINWQRRQSIPDYTEAEFHRECIFKMEEWEHTRFAQRLHILWQRILDITVLRIQGLVSALRKQHAEVSAVLASVFLLHRLLPLFGVFFSGSHFSTTFLFLLLLLHSLLHTILFFSVCISVALFLFCALLSISSSVCLSLSFWFLIFLSISFCDFWKQWACELWGCVHFHGAKGGLWIINRERMEDGGNHVQCGFRLRIGHWKPSYLPWPWPASIVFFYDWVSTQYYALLPLWSFWKGIPWHHCFQLCLLQMTD